VVIQGAGQGVTIIDGGGSGTVVTATSVDSSATLDGFTITGGFSTYGGGMYNNGSSPMVTNCTFSGNSADYGGGMENSSSSPTVTNSILWGDSPDEIYNSAVSSPSVTYSDIQGGYTGTGNINADPLFVDPDGPDNIPGNEDDDYHLTAGSPCIDTGTSSGAPDTDLEGKPRPQGAGYDMGVYEFVFPAADFSANPTSGVAPLTVHFTEQCTGDMISWLWSFGDGATNTEQNPTHTYTNPGAFTVTLTATGPGGSDTEIKTDYINVRESKAMPWIPLLLLDD